MRKLFTERARLVIYLELEDLNRLTAKARSEGRTVVEWAREVLLGDMERVQTRNVEIKRAGRKADVPMRDTNSERGTVSGDGGPIQRTAGTCPHHKRKGELCYKCDQRFGKPEIG